MINPKKVIEEIAKSCRHYFLESTFYFHHNNYFRYYITGNRISKAINNYNGVQEQIDVIKWFGDFWLYIHIRFEKPFKEYNTFITISVFQGEENDDYKVQLFRAEWDNYENEENHPQPHWHILSNQRLERSFDELIDLFDLDKEDSFGAEIKEEKLKGIDIKKIHFSMNGHWATNGSHVHRINDEATIVNWFKGLLGHIKLQLEYAIR
ncbi:hypothetical protein AHMF7605_26050 [Adhaeribacter arboris]|uniref:Uncharacterized protein n=1 Tax=Adhaeribacter arboris TaxID=2072846 RepID=A0A2T2YMI0_9BACT|nr:hypothetical protein [Adhaeribacter arboris]PSR56709.1 hypothetical protein AHMF7605_26050 [Adhaeribacter arboris]